jgi:hypothetical protein
MLCQPEACVSQSLHVLRQVDRPRDRAARRLPSAHAHKVQYRNRQSFTHVGLDEAEGKAMRPYLRSLSTAVDWVNKSPVGL